MEKRIFISSVQKEFLEERRELEKYIESDPLLGDFFSVYLLNLLPPIRNRPKRYICRPSKTPISIFV